VILFFVGSFSDMLKYVMFFETIGVSVAAIAIFMLRKKTRELDTTDIYTIKWFPLVPLIFILSYWFVTINIFISFKENPYAALFCLAAYAIGLGIYYMSVRKGRGTV
jgi:APA family basic amino acid/polyamine antiporter